MIRLIVFLAIAAVLAFAASWLADHPGEIALTWQGFQVETSVAVLLVGILVVGVLLVVLFELFRVVFSTPRRLVRGRQHARQERGFMALAQGMVAASAGDKVAAKYLSRQAERLLDQAPATLLLGAQTAQLEGDETAARQKFQEMLKHSETEFLGLRGLLAQAMKEDDHETALRLARRAYVRNPGTPWVLTTLFELQTRASHWNEALTVVGDMARYKVIDQPTATRRRAILFHLQASDERDAGRAYEALHLAQKAHKLLPEFAPAAVQAAEIAEQVGKDRQARKVLETSWRAEPHPSLARAYLALSAAPKPADRFALIERLNALAPPRHPEAGLVFAEAALADGRYEPAREALEFLAKKAPTVSVFRLLAELEQGENRDGDRARDWLAKAVDAPPDRAWMCESTGEARATWSAFGPDGRFDSLHWGTPPKIVPLLAEDAPARLILPGEPAPAAAESVTVMPPEAPSPPGPGPGPSAPSAPSAPMTTEATEAVTEPPAPAAGPAASPVSTDPKPSPASSKATAAGAKPSEPRSASGDGAKPPATATGSA